MKPPLKSSSGLEFSENDKIYRDSAKNSKTKFLKNIKAKIKITGEISIAPKLGKYLLIKFKGGSVSLYEISRIPDEIKKL